MTQYTLSFHTTHNAGASILEDGELIAAVSEERFNRIKHYGYLPYESIQYCLDEAGIEPGNFDEIEIPSDGVLADVKLLLGWNSIKAEGVSQLYL